MSSSNTEKLCSSSNYLSNSQLGYGTWQAAPGEVGNGVYEALKIGYRHLVSGPEKRWTLTAVALQLDPEECSSCASINFATETTVTDLLCRRIWPRCTFLHPTLIPISSQEFFRRCRQCRCYGNRIPMGDSSVEVELGCPSVETFKELWPLLHNSQLRMLTNIFRTNQLREPEGSRRRHQACFQGHSRPQA